MKSKKQSSIEWLVENLHVILPQSQFNDVVIQDVIQQAQQLHKQEIIDAWSDGETYMDSNKNGNEYYNDTYETDN